MKSKMGLAAAVDAFSRVYAAAYGAEINAGREPRIARQNSRMAVADFGHAATEAFEKKIQM